MSQNWKERALELNGKMSWRKIAQELGIPRSTVSDYLRTVHNPEKVPPVEPVHRAKILTLDIETSPIVAFVWGLWKQNVGLNQIHADWSILSYTAKWLHEDVARYRDCRGQGESMSTQDNGVRDDLHLLQDLRDLLDEADIVVTQNGVKFDHKKMNARFLCAGMPPPRPYHCIDTMLSAKAVAAFTSNRLAWLSSVLTDTPKDDHKKFPGFELWIECLKDNPEAWAEMEQYNVQDVFATEALYLKLRPWIQGHPNVAAFDSSTEMRCPRCGGAVRQHGWYHTNAGMYERYQCTSCQGWSRGRYTKNSIEKRKSLLGT